MATEVISRAEAIAKGLKRYFTNKPCKHGHIAERVVLNSGCTSCLWDIEKRYRDKNRDSFVVSRRNAERKYRENNRDKVREKNRLAEERRKDDPVRQESRRNARKKWEKANPEQRTAYIESWKSENHDKVLEYGRKSRLKNIDKHRDRVRVWHNANRFSDDYRRKALARVLAWEQKNPERAAEHRRKARQTRRARQYSAGGSYTNAEIRELLEKQNWCCAAPWCKVSLRSIKKELDHIIAVAKGGRNDIANLQWLCLPCNKKKRDKDPLVWAQENGH